MSRHLAVTWRNQRIRINLVYTAPDNRIGKIIRELINELLPIVAFSRKLYVDVASLRTRKSFNVASGNPRWPLVPPASGRWYHLRKVGVSFGRANILRARADKSRKNVFARRISARADSHVYVRLTNFPVVSRVNSFESLKLPG